MTRCLLALWLSACLSAGCYSTTLVQEPDNLPAGGMRVAMGMSSDAERALANPPLTLLPSLALGWRIGMTDWLETRVKVTLLGAEAGFNVLLLDGEHLHIHVLPHVAYYPAVMEDDDNYLDEEGEGRSHLFRTAAVPLIAAWRVTREVDVFAGPDLHLGYRDSDLFYAAGAHAGFVFHSSPGASQMLECSLLVGIAGPQPYGGDPLNYHAGREQLLTQRDVNFQCGVGVSWGSARAGAAAQQ